MSHPRGERSESPAAELTVSDQARLDWLGLIPGVLLMVIAALAYYEVRNLAGAAGSILGAGPVPRIFAAILFGLGAVVAVEGFVGRRIGARRSILFPILISAAVGAFMLTIEKLGLGPATGLAAAIVAGYGLRERPVACVLVVVASIATAVLLDLSKLFAVGGA